MKYIIDGTQDPVEKVVTLSLKKDDKGAYVCGSSNDASTAILIRFTDEGKLIRVQYVNRNLGFQLNEKQQIIED